MKLLFLHGPVASGKLTVARAVAARTGMPVFHNHLVVDAVASVFPFGSPGFVRLRELYWLTMFRAAAADGRSIIFTFAPEPTVSTEFPELARGAVAGSGGQVLFVRLTVPVDEQERRVGDPGRAEFGKLRSVAMLRRLRDQFAAAEAAMPASALTIDTGEFGPSEAADRIAELLGRS